MIVTLSEFIGLFYTRYARTSQYLYMTVIYYLQFSANNIVKVPVEDYICQYINHYWTRRVYTMPTTFIIATKKGWQFVAAIESD